MVPIFMHDHRLRWSPFSCASPPDSLGMLAALLDRLAHHCEILQMNGESYRFRESMKKKAGRQAK